MAIIANGLSIQSVEALTSTIQEFADGDFQVISGNIIPKGPASKFKIDIICPTNTSDDATAANGPSNPYLGFRIRRRINNAGSFVNADYIGTARTPSHLDASPQRAGASSTNNFNGGARYRMTHKTNTIIDSPSYNLGDTITYQLLVHRRGDGFMGWVTMGAPKGLGNDRNYFNFSYGLIVTEISQ